MGGYMKQDWERALIITPHLHLLNVNYPMRDRSTLHNAGCFFGLVAIKVSYKV